MDVSDLHAATGPLSELSDDTVIEGLTAALALWQRQRGFCDRAATDLCERTGASEGMLRFGLERAVRAHGVDALGSWLRSARREAGLMAEQRGPRVVLQILAGNVAGLAIPAVCESLLARSAVALKPASGDPVTPFYLKRALDQVAPVLGKAVAIWAWSGGDTESEARAFEGVDLAVASGNADTMAALDGRHPGRVLMHGPRISVGILPEPARVTDGETWSRVAREIVLWDQAGCLSPRILFSPNPRETARHLAGALRAWEAKWPSGPRDTEASARVHAFRVRYAMGDGRATGLLAAEGTEWTVVWDDRPTLETGPAQRVVRVVPHPGYQALRDLLWESQGYLQGIGVLGPAEDLMPWKKFASDLGLWCAPLEALQDPPAGWRADGISNLAEFLKRGRGTVD